MKALFILNRVIYSETTSKCTEVILKVKKSTFVVDERRTFTLHEYRITGDDPMKCVYWKKIGMHLYINVNFILWKYKVFNLNLQLYPFAHQYTLYFLTLK